MPLADYIRSRRKPILGAIASGLTYLAAKVALDLDPELAALLSGAIFAAVVERVYPIFGVKAATPQLGRITPARKRR